MAQIILEEDKERCAITPYENNLILEASHPKSVQEYLQEIARILCISFEELRRLKQYCDVSQIMGFYTALLEYNKQAEEEVWAALSSEDFLKINEAREFISLYKDSMRPSVHTPGVMFGSGDVVRKYCTQKQIDSAQIVNLVRSAWSCNNQIINAIWRKMYTDGQLTSQGLLTNMSSLYCLVNKYTPPDVLKKIVPQLLKLNRYSTENLGEIGDYVKAADLFKDEKANPTINYLLSSKKRFINLFANHDPMFSNTLLDAKAMGCLIELSSNFPDYGLALLAACFLYIIPMARQKLVEDIANYSFDSYAFILANIFLQLQLSSFPHEQTVNLLYKSVLFSRRNQEERFWNLLYHSVDPSLPSDINSNILMFILLINGVARILIKSLEIFKLIIKNDITGELGFALRNFTFILQEKLDKDEMKLLVTQAINDIKPQTSADEFGSIESAINNLKQDLEVTRMELGEMRDAVSKYSTLRQRCFSSILTNKIRFKFVDEMSNSSELDNGCSSSSPIVDPRFNLTDLPTDLQDPLKEAYGISSAQEIAEDKKGKGPAV